MIDEAGRVVARTGTLVRMGGGETQHGIWLACPNPITR